jgi:hypothetical protein
MCFVVNNGWFIMDTLRQLLSNVWGAMDIQENFGLALRYQDRSRDKFRNVMSIEYPSEKKYDQRRTILFNKAASHSLTEDFWMLLSLTEHSGNASIVANPLSMRCPVSIKALHQTVKFY